MANVPGITNLKMGGGVPSELFGNLSQSNFYEVYITTDWSSEEGMKKFLKNSDVQKSYNLDENFVTRNLGLLCSDAVLPASAFATSEVKDNFMGVNQEFAHTRLYTDFDFSFYVDDNYNSIRFFEGWIDYISSGSEDPGPISDGANPSVSNYYRRMRYPDTYKCQSVTITKFEKNLKNSIKYSFINAFPKTISAIPVTYGAADILRVTVSFNYDRYLIDVDSISRGRKSKGFVDLPPTEPSAELQARRNQASQLREQESDARALADDTGRSIEDARILASGGFIETVIE